MRYFLVSLLLLLPIMTLAAEDYEMGSYWTVTSVDTKPGHFDDYMADLKRVWRKSLEMLKTDGKVKSYRMFSNVNARVDEPNLWLLVEWTSAAAMMDAPQKYWDEHTKKLFGSDDAGDQANIKRGELRTIMSNVLLREMSFTD
ncbi:MAG: hypothetical protein JSV80_02110 [Acidobacteriota bacterium]|nr:MAG: hypothetical protein JSV80_02110 [Acidobacteriota bacterium]